MFKGHTKIELTNVHTGEVEVVESDNMMTNALAQMVNFSLSHGLKQGGLLNPFTSHIDPLFGGLWLLQKPVEEDPNVMMLPGGNKMVACAVAGQTNSRTFLTEMGSYNAAESSSSGTSRKYVYDFSTSQGNGEISCVCLTSQNAGWAGAGLAKNITQEDLMRYKMIGLSFVFARSNGCNFPAMGKYYSPYGTISSANQYLNFCLDSENDRIYKFNLSQDYLTIAYHDLTPKHFNFFRNIVELVPTKGSKQYKLPHAPTGNIYKFFYNTDEQCLYVYGCTIVNDNYMNANQTIRVFKFNINTEELTDFTVVTPYTVTIPNIAFNGDWVYFYTYTNSSNYVSSEVYRVNHVTGEKVTVPRSGINLARDTIILPFIYRNRLYLCRAGYENHPKDVVIDLTDNAMYSSPCCLFANSFCYVGSTTIWSNLVPPKNTNQIIFSFNQIADDLPIMTSSMRSLEGTSYGSSNYYDNFHVNTFAMSDYLATINNITPVQKTADKTMKVTYTITNVDEEIVE